MGLGTKIKEVLHSDKDTKHNTADTSKTPGAFPSDEVPRSQRHADTGALESSGSPRTDNISGKNSSEYTYGAHDSSMTGRDGVTSDRHDTTGTHTTAGATGSHDRSGSHDLTGSHRNKLNKDSTTAPYWGDAERVGGRHSPTADNERPFDPSKPDDSGQIEKISQSMGNDVVTSLVRQLRDQLGAKLDPAAIAQVTGGGAG